MTTAPVLAHVALSVTDLDRAVRFYTQTLGLREVPRPDFGSPGAWLAMDGAMVHLAVVESIPEPRDPFGHFALNVPTQEVHRLASAVREAGGTLFGEPGTLDQLGTTVTVAFCCDTEGNRFELTDAPPA